MQFSILGNQVAPYIRHIVDELDLSLLPCLPGYQHGVDIGKVQLGYSSDLLEPRKTHTKRNMVLVNPITPRK
jgi:hypothetical protein